MSEAEKTITARNLMKTEFRTIPSTRPAREAMDLLIDGAGGHSPSPLIAVHEDGTFAGVLTPIALFKVLLRKLRLDDLETRTEPELLAAMRDQLDVPVAEAMVREVPRAYPDDRLLTLMAINSERRLEFTPVLDGDQIIGVIYLTDIFQTAAALAITYESEGIELEPERDPDLHH